MTEDHPTRPNAQAAHTERRKSPRVAIRRLAYVNLGPYDNGGVITDISKDGLRFHMVNPVDQGGLVRVSILLGAANQVDAVGELVWLDEARKVGGVRFTVLPAGAAERIIEWASQVPEISKAGASRRTQATLPAGEDHPEASSAASTATTAATATGRPTAPQIPSHPAPMPAVATPSADAPAAPVARTGAHAPNQDIGNSFPLEPVRRAPWVPPAVRASAPIPDRAASAAQSSDLQPASRTIPQPSANPGTAIPAVDRQSQPIFQQPNAMPWITHFDPDPPGGNSSFFRGVLGGIAICAMLAFVAWFGIRHYGWTNPLASLGNFDNTGVSNRDLSSPPAPADAAPGPAATAPSEAKPAAPLSAPQSTPPSTNTPATSPQPSPSQPAQTTSPSSQPPQPLQQRQAAPPAATVPPGTTASPANTTGIPNGSATASPLPPQNQARETALNTTPIAEPSSASATQYGAPAASAQPPRGADSGEAQLQLARQYLDGRGRPRNPTVASQLLWSAVEKGNSVAEMDLADLYLHGDGVARNCDQARVLLSVASQKGNAEATHKLLEMDHAGCR